MLCTKWGTSIARILWVLRLSRRGTPRKLGTIRKGTMAKSRWRVTKTVCETRLCWPLEIESSPAHPPKNRSR